VGNCPQIKILILIGEKLAIIIGQA